jgi:hypothetical protein
MKEAAAAVFVDRPPVRTIFVESALGRPPPVDRAGILGYSMHILERRRI